MPVFAPTLFSRLSDAALILQAQRGDQAAFGALVQRHTALVEHCARRVVGEGSQDVAQQVFLSAWLNRRHYDASRGSVRGWLCGIAHNRAIDALRHQRRRIAPVTLGESGYDVVCPAELPADAAARRDEAARVRGAVARLGQEQRAVITLAYFSGLSQVEIHTRTAAPLGTVKSRVRLALTALRADLRPTAA